MKKQMIIAAAILALLLTGCAATEQTPAASSVPAEPGIVVQPMPDATMEDLQDCILPVSLEEGGAYVDDTGVMRMELKIYSCDMYDAAAVIELKAGDAIVFQGEQIDVESVERNEAGAVCINGGLDKDGFDLVSAGGGLFLAVGYNDARYWNQVGEETFRVSESFEFKDSSDPDGEAQTYYAGSFLVDEVEDYNFTPYNTTVRIEGGQVVYMERVYTP